jgi:hypothetical protein
MANTASPARKDLDALAGEWQVELSFPANPPRTVLGHVSFEWLEDGAFFVMRSGNKSAGSPSSVSVIGKDDSADTFTMLYADDRGVSRIYQMSVEGGEWKQWREAPGFCQRFAGTFSDDDNTIIARWEKSSDGTQWEHDFDLRYTRMTETCLSMSVRNSPYDIKL